MRMSISILIIAILIMGGSFFTFVNGMEPQEKGTREAMFGESYIAHQPIRINSDSELAALASAENWSGDGTADSPYLIENYSINGAGFGYGIYVGNTTLHFEIRNCYIYSANGGPPPYFGGSAIILYNASNALIEGNRLQSSLRYGVYSIKMHNLEISNNLISSNYVGVYLKGARSDSVVHNNTFHVNRYAGIHLQDCTGLTIRDNAFQDNHIMGAYLYISQQIVFKNNTFGNDGIFIKGNAEDYWDTHDIDTTNTVNGKPIYYLTQQNGGKSPEDGGEIIIAASYSVTVEGAKIGYTSASIIVGFSSQIAIKNTTVHNTTLYGIYFYHSENCTINNITSRDNMQGVNLELSDDIKVTNSTFRGNMRGLWLVNSQQISVSSNEFENNNILISGDSSEYWDSHIIDESNVANGRPIKYVANTIGESITGTMGEIIIASSHNIVVEHASVVGGDAGLMIGFSSSIIVQNSTFLEQGFYNIFGNDVSSSIFSGVVAEYGEITGATFRYSNDNVISNSSFSHNLYGIAFYRCDNNIVRNNTIQDNFFHGFRLTFSSGNRIYNNNFIDNNPNAYDSSTSNFWNASYPTGGNYWSDYSGNDDDGDGIGDTPYTSGNIVDSYPLMNPADNIIPELEWPILMLSLFLAASLIWIRRKMH